MRYLSLGEVETKRQQAIEFLRRIGRDEDAGRFEDMTVAEYAEHRGAEIVANPTRRVIVAGVTATPTKAELEQDIDSAIEILENALDPAAERGELVQAIEEALSALEGEEEEGEVGEDVEGEE